MSTVTIVIGETLEAAMLIASLVVVGNAWFRRSTWLFPSLIAGALSAAIMGYFAATISDLWDGRGQEMTNAGTLILASVLLIVHHVLVSKRRAELFPGKIRERTSSMIQLSTATVLVVLSVQREGAETIALGLGFFGTDGFPPFLTGGTIGLIIGAVIGMLLYYSLSALARFGNTWLAETLLVFIAAGMMSHAIGYLAQAGMVDTGLPLWDSSFMIAENTVGGKFVTAVLGYEATPSMIQVAFHFTTLLVFLLFTICSKLVFPLKRSTQTMDTG